ncbi:MAG: CRISPR system precrRNA processing endoribonuclease RAMP protein Cas6 [Ktedonobacteraceae bacterium]
MDSLSLSSTSSVPSTLLETTAPAKLYAFLLKLRPLQEGTLQPFSGELVHAAWLSWLGTAAPDVATWLHEGNKRRLFTCSSLQFPLPPEKMLEVERRNVHWPLSPEKTYTIRVTLLLGELFPLFHRALTDFTRASATAGVKPPFMRLGKQSLLLEEVVLENNDPTGWTGFTSFANMVDAARAIKPANIIPLKLEFASLTAFNRGNAKNRAYGNYSARLPLPNYVFSYLAKRWNELAPPELANLVQRSAIEQYIQEEGIIIADYNLKPHAVKLSHHWEQGFTGTCKYLLRGPDDPITEESPLTVRQQILLLGQLAFYCGVGHKTAMGMGRVRQILI